MYVPYSGKCAEALGSVVNDKIGCGDCEFLKLFSETKRKFDMKPKVFLEFEFAGKTIERMDHRYIAQQSKYAATLTKLPPNATFEDVRTLRHNLAWLSLALPDISSAANMPSQTTNINFNKNHTRKFNKVVRRLEETKDRGLQYLKLDIETALIETISDASFANNPDLPSKLGNIIVIKDQSGRANVVSYASYKSKRMVRSVLGGEVYAFADCFDASFTLLDVISRLFSRRQPIAIIIYSASLFNVIVQSSRTFEMD